MIALLKLSAEAWWSHCTNLPHNFSAMQRAQATTQEPVLLRTHHLMTQQAMNDVISLVPSEIFPLCRSQSKAPDMVSDWTNIEYAVSR